MNTVENGEDCIKNVQKVEIQALGILIFGEGGGDFDILGVMSVVSVHVRRGWKER